MRECSFEGIGGVWDAKMWQVFKGEEPWKICFQTPVSTTESLVREVPVPGELINGFLCKKVFPFFVPQREPVTKTRFVGLREEQHEFL